MSPSKPAQPKDAQDRSGEKDLVASDSEKEKQPVNAATSGVPARPVSKVPDAQERRRKRRLLIIHTWIAKFFTWILLLGFVLLPSTYTKVQTANQQNAPASSGDDSDLNVIPDPPWFAIGYTCCLINAVAICWLWRLRKDDHKWLFTNLFFAGLVNAFSGLISAFVNCYAVQGGTWGASTKSTVALASGVTFIYAVLTVVYYRKSLQARRRRASGGKPGVSSAMV